MVYQNEILGSSIDFSNKVKYSENNTSNETLEEKNRTLFANQEDRFHCTIDEDDLCNSVKGTFNLEINGTDINKAYDSHKDPSITLLRGNCLLLDDRDWISHSLWSVQYQ